MSVFWNVIPPTRFPTLTFYARKIFSLVATSASAERSFSMMGYIHCKLRNRLKLDAVDKLMYVRCNHKYVDEDQQDSAKRARLEDVDEDEWLES